MSESNPKRSLIHKAFLVSCAFLSRRAQAPTNANGAPPAGRQLLVDFGLFNLYDSSLPASIEDQREVMMALCKADLVAAVLKQLGHPVPDASRLTEAVMSASADLKKQAGIDVKACLLMTPVNASAYQGGIREQTKFAGGVKV